MNEKYVYNIYQSLYNEPFPRTSIKFSEERRFTQDLHGATSQKTAFFIATAAKSQILHIVKVWLEIHVKQVILPSQSQIMLQLLEPQTTETRSVVSEMKYMNRWTDTTSPSAYFCKPAHKF
jgi:hypothetical protein